MSTKEKSLEFRIRVCEDVNMLLEGRIKELETKMSRVFGQNKNEWVK